MQGLWQAKVQASGQLTDLLQPSIPAEVRRSAALALGYAADPANDQLLFDLLRNPEVKREAAFAVLLGGNQAAAAELYRQIDTDRELREILQDFLMADDVDFFNMITAQHFESGEIFRRLEVARTPARTAKARLTFSFPWQQVVARLKSGWNGPGGLALVKCAPSSTRLCAVRTKVVASSPPKHSAPWARWACCLPRAMKLARVSRKRARCILKQNRGAAK